MTQEQKEYHVIDVGTGTSHGGFKTLHAARSYIREEEIDCWQIFVGNTLIESHVEITEWLCVELAQQALL